MILFCAISNMPVMDGLEFVRQLQAMDAAKRAPVVMITTEGSESHVKPFTPDQVKEHVVPVLEQ